MVEHMNSADENREILTRRKYIRVGYEEVLRSALFGMSKLPQFVSVLKGFPELPADVTVLHVTVDHLDRTFTFFIVSREFDIVPDGMPCPPFVDRMQCHYEYVELPQAQEKA